ncbi:hypothetical protein [Massilia sp. Dwa41.01b]|uniref:hypothetical protein n=1 Tax=Massilia sp. Dwa41.01b TaxID=2709302 RepID=UPI001600D670|nr:hypothetical protein [Massilia sp. Dwa41.01b]QNB00865.1 hypothetical protein G4G31_21995 [Massilia sp. Se16.2.3]
MASAGMLAGWLASAGAAPANVVPEDARAAKELTKDLSRLFTLPAALQLDPALREAAQRMGADHLARMEKQFAQWAAEERKRRPASRDQAFTERMMYALTARMLNELAYWHIEPGDAGYEQATLEVLRTSPQVCQFGDKPRFRDFSSRILRIQAMSPAQREMTLASESRMLERWGKPRPEPLPWPNPLPRDAAMHAIANLAAGTARPAIALAPHLADHVLSAGNQYDQLPAEEQCAIQRWWLSESLAQGQAPAAVLNAFRYGTLITATERYEGMYEPTDEDKTSGRPVYPRMAALFEVEGVTRLRREFDAAGKPVGVTVVKRKITAGALPGVRPIAFEDAFDAASLNHALASAASAKPESTRAKEFEMVWSLEVEQAPPDSTKETSAPAQPKARKKKP